MSTKRNPSFDRLLHHMSLAVVKTLTPQQLEELQKAMQATQPSKHAIDIRLNIPFPKRGFYFVIFAGRERRSRERLRQEKFNRVYASAVGRLVLLGSLAVLAVPSILWLIRLNHESKNIKIHSTSIPWLQEQNACQQTGREWHDGQCWDSEWSHEF